MPGNIKNILTVCGTITCDNKSVEETLNDTKKNK